jgi:HEPN domain-containing protein
VHDLIYLIDELSISVPEKYGKFVYKLNDASIPIRYPYDLNKLISVYNKDITGKIMENTKEVKEWIKQQ